MVELASLLLQALPDAAVIGLAALGELLVERAGRINLGLEGLLHFGYGAAAAAAVATGSLAAGYLAAAAAAGLLVLVYFLAVELLGVDQVVVGLSLVFLGMGLGDIAGLTTGGVAGPALAPREADLVDAAALAAATAVLYLLLYRDWRGYALRSLGEDEKAARSLGVEPRRYRLAALAGEALLAAAAATLFLAVNSTGAWRSGRITGYGWLALGMVILGYWHPLGVAAASLLLGLLLSSRSLLPTLLPPNPVLTIAADAAPYLAVILALAAASWLYERRGVKPPASIWRA